MKLLIIGHGRHGKDTVAEILNENYGLTFKSSSQAASDIFLYEKLKTEFGYQTPEECYIDRHNKRARWHQEISEYNTPDKSKLAEGIMADNDIYVGMRCSQELESCIDKQLFDHIVWVSADGRISYQEGADSFNIDKEYANYFIDNSGTMDDLVKEVDIMYSNFIRMSIDSQHLQETFHELQESD